MRACCIPGISISPTYLVAPTAFWVWVLPELLRRGIATEILHLIEQAAHKENRRLLTSSGNSNVEAGRHFIERFGAELGQT